MELLQTPLNYDSLKGPTINMAHTLKSRDDPCRSSKCTRSHPVLWILKEFRFKEGVAWSIAALPVFGECIITNSN